MEIEFDTYDDVAVIRLSGDLNGASADALRDSVYTVLGRRKRQVLLNLAGVAGVDAAGLGALARIHRMTTVVGAAITLTGVSPRVRELLDVVGLVACFDIVASECEAVEDLEMCGQCSTAEGGLFQIP
jgi:anti-anti-sigma factor